MIITGPEKSRFYLTCRFVCGRGRGKGGLNYPEVKTIALPENLSFAAANNIAIKSVNTEYVALLNNDAVPHPLWLEKLLEALKHNPDAGFAASKMLFYHNLRAGLVSIFRGQR